MTFETRWLNIVIYDAENALSKAVRRTFWYVHIQQRWSAMLLLLVNCLVAQLKTMHCILWALLTGWPWDEKNNLNTSMKLSLWKHLICIIKEHADNPISILTRTLKKDRLHPEVYKRNQMTMVCFVRYMIKASLMAVVTVLERQYSRYFGLELTDQL